MNVITICVKSNPRSICYIIYNVVVESFPVSVVIASVGNIYRPGDINMLTDSSKESFVYLTWEYRNRFTAKNGHNIVIEYTLRDTRDINTDWVITRYG